MRESFFLFVYHKLIYKHIWDDSVSNPCSNEFTNVSVMHIQAYTTLYKGPLPNKNKTGNYNFNFSCFKLL